MPPWCFSFKAWYPHLNGFPTFSYFLNQALRKFMWWPLTEDCLPLFIVVVMLFLLILYLNLLNLLLLMFSFSHIKFLDILYHSRHSNCLLWKQSYCFTDSLNIGVFSFRSFLAFILFWAQTSFSWKISKNINNVLCII